MATAWAASTREGPWLPVRAACRALCASFLQGRGPGNTRPPSPPAPTQGGLESLEQLEARAEQALEELAARHPGQRLLVVTHGGFLSAAYRQGDPPGGTCSEPHCSTLAVDEKTRSFSAQNTVFGNQRS